MFTMMLMHYYYYKSHEINTTWSVYCCLCVKRVNFANNVAKCLLHAKVHARILPAGIIVL